MDEDVVEAKPLLAGFMRFLLRGGHLAHEAWTYDEVGDLVDEFIRSTQEVEEGDSSGDAE